MPFREAFISTDSPRKSDGTHDRLIRSEDTGSNPEGRAAPDLRTWLRGDEPARPRGRGRDPGRIALQPYQHQAGIAVRPGPGPRQRVATSARSRAGRKAGPR